MKDYLLRFWDFLKTHDFQTLLDLFRQLDWRDVLKSPFTWLIALPILLMLILTKRYKLMILTASLVAFLVLIQFTLPPGGDQIPLSNMLTFLGGAMAIVGVNLYFLFIRE